MSIVNVFSNPGSITMFSLRKFIINSLLYDFRLNIPIALGGLLGTAVLCGAFLIGDSMRSSLRELSFERLGKIDMVLSGDRFFEPDYFENFDLPRPWTGKSTAILIPAAVEYDNDSGRKTLGINLIGADDFFGAMFGFHDPPSNWDRNEIVINRELASRLGVEKEGGALSLRIAKPESIPQESALGRRAETLVRARLNIRKIVPNEGIGRFSLRANQSPEPLAIIPIEWLQAPNRLDLGTKVNAVFLACDNPETVSDEQAQENLGRVYRPGFKELGIIVDSEGDFSHIKSERMMFTRPQADKITSLIPKDGAGPALVYLAQSISLVRDQGRRTPYSTVCACDFFQLEEGELALNRWTADDLGAEIGDRIELEYFAPESLYGKTVTKTASFTVKKILEMNGLAADPLLVPEMHGISDAKSISQWNPPFPFDSKAIRAKDENYWDDYNTTPKVFVNYTEGKRLWGGRFGDVSTFIIDTKIAGTPEIKPKSLPPELFGMGFQPIKSLSLDASAGTTPFQVLFVSFSFFIIASALMLLGMLMRLSVERKSRRIGTMLALGFPRRKITRILLLEGGALAFTGAIFGIPAGIGYAAIMIHGLRTWWVDAITVPFVELHISPFALSTGFFTGLFVSLVAIFLSVRGTGKIPAMRLLVGDFRDENETRFSRLGKQRKSRPVRNLIFVSCALAVVILSIAGLNTRDEMQRAGLFFGTGSAALVLAIVFFVRILQKRARSEVILRSLASLALANSARNSVRSGLCIGLVASTVFLVLSVGVFRIEKISNPTDPNSGTGGFDLITETRLPLYFDIDTEDGREELSISDRDSKILEETHSRNFAFRVRSGDEAGCLNLYQPKNPRILGLGKDFIERGGFGFHEWPSILEPMTTDPDGIKRVPVVLEANTAMYSLHLYGGVGEKFEIDDGSGGKIRCEIKGLLSNSFLQGDILMGEPNLLELFPDTGGYRFFLWESEDTAKLRTVLFDSLGEYGLEDETPPERLSRYFAIQNTYISTFRSLGVLGLSFGILGLGILQLRNVFERRRELAMLQALGFTKPHVIALVFSESMLILLAGLAAAIFATAFACPDRWMNFAFIKDTFRTLIALLTVGFFSNFIAIRALLKIPIAVSLAEE